jgi:hypothetical protein
MKGRSRRRLGLWGFVLIAMAFTAACAGSPGTPDGSVVGSPGGHDPPPTRLVTARVTVTIPPGRTRDTMQPGYVSVNTRSLSIQLASVDGRGVTGVSATLIETARKSPGCTAHDGATVCTATVWAAAGDDVFSVTTYAGADATGALLSVGTVSAKMSSGGGGFQITSALSLALDGLIASLKLKLAPNRAARGKPMTAAVSLVPFDSSGAQIVGGSDFASPIALTVQGDSSGAFRLHAQGTSGSSLTIGKPSSGITLTYDGNVQASSVTIAGNVSAPNGASVNAPFTVQGTPPPPPVGTIYALNLGSNDGLAATVTEYGGSANGNVAPERTLQLNAKLYARNIAVDAGGNLYVGYFDSSTGYQGSNGAPDTGNVVAIYAPGASGTTPPQAILTSDPKTRSALFPIYDVLNASGGLVAYGATTVDANIGDAVLTYAAGSSGPAAPAHGWNFTNPTIRYAGPTGLALDAAGNFYVNGALKSGLNTVYGVFVASAADIGNPNANPARIIPWDSTTELTPGFTTNLSLDASGEIFVANALLRVKGSNVSCQGRTNVFAAGASGGTTDAPPLRVLVLDGVFTQNPLCASTRSPLPAFFPSIQVYGPNVFVADDFNNAIDVFSSNAGGIVKPTLRIAGPATGLNAPISLVVSSLSGRTMVRPATGGLSLPVPSRAQTPHALRTQ